MVKYKKGAHKLLRQQVRGLLEADDRIEKVKKLAGLDDTAEDEEKTEKKLDQVITAEVEADEPQTDTSKEDAKKIEEPIEDDTEPADGKYPYAIELSGIRLTDEFAKAFFLFTRAKFKAWKYEDQLMGWQPEVVNKALKDYKRFMLDIMLGSTHGDVRPKGILAKPEFLGLEEIFKGLKQQKYGDTREISSLLRKQVTTYMQMVFPFEKRIIFDLYQGGFVSTKGELQNLDKAIKFLGLRGTEQYKSEDEKSLESDVKDEELDKEMGEDEEI